MNMSYKVGDKVVVKKDLNEEGYYGDNTVVSEMVRFKGKTVTIDEVTYFGQYILKEDNLRWYWTDEMFEGLAEDDDFSDTAKLSRIITGKVAEVEVITEFKCGNCRGKLESSYKYCPSCGAELIWI